MARPERILDPTAGPVPQLAHALRELRRSTPGPTSYRELNSTMNYSTLSRAANGRTPPTWQVCSDYVSSLGHDPQPWRPQWEHAVAAHKAGHGHDPAWLFRAPAAVTLPDPASVHTSVQLHAAIAEIVRAHDLGVLATHMSADLRRQLGSSQTPLAVVQEIVRRPDATPLPLLQLLIKACQATDDQVRGWSAAWARVRESERRAHLAADFPRPHTVYSPEQLCQAIQRMSTGVTPAELAVRLDTLPRTVEHLLAAPDQADPDLLVAFVIACGVAPENADQWRDAQCRAQVTRDRRRDFATYGTAVRRKRPTVDLLGPGDLVALRRVALHPGQPPGRRPARLTRAGSPDPTKADSYDALLDAMRTLFDAAEVSVNDVEHLTEGRLRASKAARILAGKTPATGQDIVLLVRACGGRGIDVDTWVDTWHKYRRPSPRNGHHKTLNGDKSPDQAKPSNRDRVPLTIIGLASVLLLTAALFVSHI
jgi:hypothetical protein